MERGYSSIGLVSPKTPANVGSVMRACGVYGASQCFFTGTRFKKAKQFITDPQKHYRTIPLTNVENLRDVIPYDCVPVAVDLIEGAIPLTEYVHPERAFYIFGPEDGTLGKETLRFCRDVVYVPTNGCMNLAATVNVILYDRMAKQVNK
jgi:tRNA(Leu) C34 or U34 (ribose-2'-O)-methylase TrmL